MEMFRFNNADKSGRNHRIGLAKKLAGVLLAGVMIATNFAGVEPGISCASNFVEVTDLSQILDSLYIKSGNYILETDFNHPNFPTVSTDQRSDGAIIDLNGHQFEVGVVNLNSDVSICIMDSSSSGNGFFGQIENKQNANLSVSGGTVSIFNNWGTITQTGGSVTILSNNGTYIQTGGTNPNNKTIALNASGGTPATTTVTTVTVSGEEKLYTIPTAPTAPSANHTFDGWFTAPDGGDQISTDTVFTNNTTIYAHWTVTSIPATNTSTTSNSVTSSPSNTNISDGTLTPENPSADVTKDYLDELTEQLEEAIKAGGAQTIYWNEGTALPGPVMKLLSENPQITLVFSYTYEGLDYVVTLPGKYVKYDPNVPWCGPLYLYGLYGKYGTTTVPVTTTTQAGERSYTVISGATLWGIAMRLGTTVEELVRLNNITNPDRIDIGQIIRY